MFILLCLSEGFREIPVIESTGNVSIFTEADTDNLVHIVVGFFDF